MYLKKWLLWRLNGSMKELLKKKAKQKTNKKA